MDSHRVVVVVNFHAWLMDIGEIFLTVTDLQQEETARTLEAEGNSSLMEKPAAISGYLKIIRVECGDWWQSLQSFKVLEYIGHRNYYQKDQWDSQINVS